MHTVLEHGYGRQELASAVAAEGLRPTLPADAPPGLLALLRDAWQLEPSARPSAAQVRDRLLALLAEQQQQQAAAPPALATTDPEAALRRYGRWFGKVFQLPAWVDEAPRVRVRTISQRANDSLVDLAVLNERLAGAPSPWEARHRLELLRTRRRNWEHIVEYVTQAEAAATLDLIEEAAQRVRVGTGRCGASRQAAGGRRQLHSGWRQAGQRARRPLQQGAAASSRASAICAVSSSCERAHARTAASCSSRLMRPPARTRACRRAGRAAAERGVSRGGERRGAQAAADRPAGAGRGGERAAGSHAGAC